MDKDFILGSVIWGAVVVIIACTALGWGITATNNDHNFDVTCINKNKTIQYHAVAGESYAKKECK